MKKLIITTVAALVILLIGCKEEPRLDHIDANAPAPTPISNPTFTNIAGGAVIKYTLPNDPNFLYVKAVYERRPGVFAFVNASNFSDSIVVEGFGYTDPATVRLISIGRNEKEASEVLSVTIIPKTPPVMQVYDDMIVKEAIGGIRLIVKNPSKTDLSYRVRKKNDTFPGGWQDIRMFYSRSADIILTQRGLEAEESEFAINISDTWGNTSDTLYTTLTPIFEKEVIKPYDSPQMQGDIRNEEISKLWDGKFEHYSHNLFPTNANTAPLPKPFTIDLRRKVELCRMVVHQRGRDVDTYYTYDATSVKRFAVYGSAADDPNGSIDHPDWIKLGEFTGFRPSGLPPGMYSTPEDYMYGCIDGESFEFVDENGDIKATPAVRYVKWHTLETWSGRKVGDWAEVIIAEIDFFGKVIGFDPETPEEE